MEIIQTMSNFVSDMVIRLGDKVSFVYRFFENESYEVQTGRVIMISTSGELTIEVPHIHGDPEIIRTDVSSVLLKEL